MEQNQDAIFILDREGYHVEVNKKASELLGYTEEELKGLSLRDIVVPSHIPDSEEKSKRLFRGEEIPTYEKEFRRKDGSIIPVEITASGIRNKSDEVKYVQSIVRDITERKKTEEQRRQAKEDAEFYADVLAHDVGNINQSIMVSLYMVENTEDKKKRKQYINKAVESIKRSKRLAKNIRMFKEINQRNATRINLNKSIRQSIERIKERFDRDIVVEYIEVKKHYIKANKFLEEVFISILENAVKYTQEEPVCIDIAVEEKEGRCNISIRDYGIGISKKKREDILESLETLSKRTGMGLYLVKKILQTFDGSFAIKEAPKGTEVVVRVPTIS